MGHEVIIPDGKRRIKSKHITAIRVSFITYSKRFIYRTVPFVVAMNRSRAAYKPYTFINQNCVTAIAAKSTSIIENLSLTSISKSFVPNIQHLPPISMQASKYSTLLVLAIRNYSWVGEKERFNWIFLLSQWRNIHLRWTQQCSLIREYPNW